MRRNRKRPAAYVLVAATTMGLCQCSLLVDLDGLDVPGAGAVVAAVADAEPDADPFNILGGSDGGYSGLVGPGGGDGAPESGEDDAMTGTGADGAVVESDGDSAAKSGANDDGGDAAASEEGGDAAAPDASDGCVVVTHSNGVGETWQDCVPLGTYTQAQAEKACAAHSSTGCTNSSTCSLSYVTVIAGGTEYYWVYAAPGGKITAGDVLEYTTAMVKAGVTCQSLSSSHTWQ